MGTFPQEAALWRAGSPAGVASAGLFDTLAVLAEVFLPTVAKGVIIRRPSMVALAAALDLDRRAVRRMQKTRRRYGSHPLMLRIPGKPVVLLLDAKDVHQVLAGTPEPFSSATSLKRSAVGHFEAKTFWSPPARSVPTAASTTKRCSIRIARSIAKRFRSGGWRWRKWRIWPRFANRWIGEPSPTCGREW